MNAKQELILSPDSFLSPEKTGEWKRTLDELAIAGGDDLICLCDTGIDSLLNKKEFVEAMFVYSRIYDGVIPFFYYPIYRMYLLGTEYVKRDANKAKEALQKMSLVNDARVRAQIGLGIVKLSDDKDLLTEGLGMVIPYYYEDKSFFDTESINRLADSIMKVAEPLVPNPKYVKFLETVFNDYLEVNRLADIVPVAAAFGILGQNTSEDAKGALAFAKGKNDPRALAYMSANNEKETVTDTESNVTKEAYTESDAKKYVSLNYNSVFSSLLLFFGVVLILSGLMGFRVFSLLIGIVLIVIWANQIKKSIKNLDADDERVKDELFKKVKKQRIASLLAIIPGMMAGITVGDLNNEMVKLSLAIVFVVAFQITYTNLIKRLIK